MRPPASAAAAGPWWWWVCCLPRLHWLLLGALLAALPSPSCATNDNRCDFSGSGLGQELGVVEPVYLSCASGRVEWQYPRAGLRVILRSPRGQDRDFRACIKGDTNFAGARLLLEGHRSLIPLLAKDDQTPRHLPRCFNSYKGQAAVYLEAEPTIDDPSNLKKQVAAFNYDLQTLPKGSVYDPQDECRPCSDEEVLQLYCSGDFVARGSIIRVEDDPELSRTLIIIRATKLFQQTSPIFKHTTAQAENDLNALDSAGPAYIGTLEVPLKCGARSGLGEFLVMGDLRLGSPILRCATRYEDWEKLAIKLHDRAHCVLEL
ncbi:unnamed protein product [Meganyctiphanes norvegica]|uniref:Meteorin-like protein n=1 Tax=Meganyctiphanes norvegica TaxID=48144 RepID=A0AAV2R8U5_MEGNR